MIDSFMTGFSTLLGYAVIIACCARVLVPIAAGWIVEALNALQNLKNSQ